MKTALELADEYYGEYVPQGDDDVRTELINGKIYAMAGASTKHNLAKGNIYRAFGNYLDGKRCVPISDGEDVYLDTKDRYIPDVMIVCDPDKLKRNGVHGAPDLVVEVLSPSTSLKDRYLKRWVYERNGVREYWLVDPDALVVEVYRLAGGKYGEPEFYGLRSPLTPQEIKVSLYDDFTVPLESIFERLREFKE